MLWGFWNLGGDLTLSPFNAALAFDSPLLKDVNSVRKIWRDYTLRFFYSRIFQNVVESAQTALV